jgi:two-component system response regulator DegU
MEPFRDINVLFADNHPLTLSGLKSAVAAQSDIRVLAECVDRDRLKDSVRSQSPNVLFVSSEFLQDELGDLTQLVSENEGTRVILLTSRNDPQFFEDALRCGASGIFERERPVEYVPLAIRKVMNGGFWFEQALAERMLGDVLHQKNKPPDPEKRKIAAITDRERRVLELICQGLRNKEIAELMQVSETTVSRHVTSIFRKLEVEDRTSLVIYAVKKNLVSL